VSSSGKVAVTVAAVLVPAPRPSRASSASEVGWAFERLSRHPDVLAALVAEADGDDNELRQATILEVQRNKTVIDGAGRQVHAPVFELG
jgi:cytochrome P450 family 138